MKKILSLLLTLCFIFASGLTAYADDTGIERFFYPFFWNDVSNSSQEKNDADPNTPVIISPSSYEKVISSDMVRIEWLYGGNEPCTVCVRDSAGNISELKGESGNTAKIMPNKLARGGTYTITVKAGSRVSEPRTLKVADIKDEVEEIVSRTSVTKAEPKISRETIMPEGAFASKESADKHVKTISVKVWKLSGGKKIPSAMSLTVNSALADTVIKIFDEIYNNSLQFPISSLGCYNYRTTASGERLSEHAYGTAIDVNSNENYCVYSENNVVGSFYKPYESPYSLTPEIINIFRKYNFYWGASFGDYMHFSYFGT